AGGGDKAVTRRRVPARSIGRGTGRGQAVCRGSKRQPAVGIRLRRVSRPAAESRGIRGSDPVGDQSPRPESDRTVLSEAIFEVSAGSGKVRGLIKGYHFTRTVRSGGPPSGAPHSVR